MSFLLRPPVRGRSPATEGSLSTPNGDSRASPNGTAAWPALGLVRNQVQTKPIQIKERQREGISLAKERGVYRGRARKLTDEQIVEVRQLVEAGVPKTKIAADLDCSRRVVYDALAGRGPYASMTP